MKLISTLRHSRQLSAIDKLTNDSVLHIYDCFSREELDKILSKGVPKYIVGDHFSWIDEIEFSGLPLYTLPLYAEKDTRILANGVNFDNKITTTSCFNFIINKKQVNRFLCIKFVEYFALKNFDYTWSEVDKNFDLTYIINEIERLGDSLPMDQEIRSFILSPIQLEKKIIVFPHQFIDTSAINNYGGPYWAWKNGIQHLFFNSAISLITESVSYQKVSLFTEKTVYSVLGLTFPIWVGGGYNQAKEWNKIGFDTFDDIIDHSYQGYNTLIERCYYAFTQNIDLLKDKDKAAELRLKHKDRLLKNRELLLQNQLGKFIAKEISNFPEDLQSSMPEILNFFGSHEIIKQLKTAK